MGGLKAQKNKGNEMKEDKISKEIMEKLFHHIDLLKQELCSLKEKDFPFKDTNWFYEKTVVLARIIGRGPELPANDDIEIMRLLQGPIDYTSRVKKGYDRYEIDRKSVV